MTLMREDLVVAAGAGHAIGPMQTAQALLLQLKKTVGRVINGSSMSAFVASDSITAYAATNGALAQFTRTLAVELGEHGIPVNACGPSFVRTGIDGVPTPKEFQERYRVLTPLRRLAVAEAIVGPVMFLALAQTSHFSAIILPLDGGYLAVSQATRTDS
jgi:NAD(P)-dependent dehydrogenase (short-subunit alcohol dehydrogenase family)